MEEDDDKLTEVLTFRMSAEDREAIDKLSASEGRQRAAWLRRRMRDVLTVYRARGA